MAAGVVKKVLLKQPPNPNKAYKTLAPWFGGACKQAKDHYLGLRKIYGGAAPPTIQARKHYI
jgi:hypothetical protein